MAGRGLLFATTALVLVLTSAIVFGLATSSVGESPVATPIPRLTPGFLPRARLRR